MARRRRAVNRSTRQLITQLKPRSPISEQFRALRTNLQFASVDKTLKTLLVTSAITEEGKSTTAANLAIVFANQDKKVLLVDADLRKPSVHYTFRIDNRRGLSSVLVSEDSLADTVKQSNVPNLDILSSGPIPPNPSELLGSNRMKALIEKAKETYDMIIFDTPPTLAVTDAQILGNHIDGALLVVRSKQTDREEAVKAKELLNAAKVKILGAVLNDVKIEKDQYYYYGQ